MDVAACLLAPRDAAVRARVSKQGVRHSVLPDLTMLNLEDLGMSQFEPRPGLFGAIAAPAFDGPVIASPMESVQHHADELNK